MIVMCSGCNNPMAYKCPQCGEKYPAEPLVVCGGGNPQITCNCGKVFQIRDGGECHSYCILCVNQFRADAGLPAVNEADLQWRDLR